METSSCLGLAYAIYAFAPSFLVGATHFICLVLLEAKTAFRLCVGCTVSEASSRVKEPAVWMCVVCPCCDILIYKKNLPQK